MGGWTHFTSGRQQEGLLSKISRRNAVPAARADVPNLFLTMYPFSILTDEHVPLKLLITWMGKITKIH